MQVEAMKAREKEWWEKNGQLNYPQAVPSGSVLALYGQMPKASLLGKEWGAQLQ